MRDMYAGLRINTPTPQITQLSAYIFGAYTLLESFLRLMTAYNINNAPLYAVALFSYVVILGHLNLEWLKFRNMAGSGSALYLGIGIDLVGVLWMASQWRFYVG